MTPEEIAALRKALEVDTRHADFALAPTAIKAATAKMVTVILGGIGIFCGFVWQTGSSVMENQKDMQRIMLTQNDRIADLSNSLKVMQDQIQRNSEKIQEMWFRGKFNVETHIDKKSKDDLGS